MARSGLHRLLAIDVAHNQVAFETKFEVVPLARRHAADVCFVQRIFATYLHILPRQDKGLLLFVADEFLLVSLAARQDERRLTLPVELHVIAFGPYSITRTDVAETPHHACLVAWIQIDVCAHLVVLPAGIAHDGVVMPFGCPAKRVRTNSLTDASHSRVGKALRLGVGSLHEFEAANQVG